MTSKNVLAALDLYKAYHQGGRDVHVLNGLTLEVPAGDTVAIVGVSGSGKSTLLHLLAGLDHPDAGSVSIAGTKIENLSENALGKLRNESLGFVYQFHHLLPEFSALENVAMPLMIGGSARASAMQSAAELLSEVGLEDRGSHHPAALSGGERQRVAIARALVTRPDLVLADEPTGNLDEETASEIHELVLSLAAVRQTAFVVVTHNSNFAGKMNRVLRLHAGALEPSA
jgi:lipoprotein-releasing system ATP-binding protein